MEDNSIEYQSVYLGVYPELPVDAPIGCPHLIDVDSLDHKPHGLQNLRIADAVVTILYKVTPGALTAFLDLDRPYFHYIHASYPGVHDGFCIKRDGRFVKVGLLKDRNFGGWSEFFEYHIGGAATDQWTPVSFSVSNVNIGNGNGDGSELFEDESGYAYDFLTHEKPWSSAWPDNLVELVCGLSHDRNF